MTSVRIRVVALFDVLTPAIDPTLPVLHVPPRRTNPPNWWT
ncbi:hypothetical protein [Streptomyces sp. NPDC057686]